MKKLFKDKKVVVMGLGLHGGGVGVAKFFAKQGTKVLVTDLKTAEELQPSIRKLKRFKVEYVLGSHRQKDFAESDLIIKNPGVPQNSPYLKIARDNKVPVKNDIDIFFDLCKAPIIGVTGTKGKSTAATLIYLFLKNKYQKTILAGNIGISPLELISKISKKSKVVLELSSFELEDLKNSPNVAVFTTLLPDHLDRYKNFEEYIKAKTPIFLYQKKNDILILNYDNLKVRKLAVLAPSKVYFYSKNILPKEYNPAAFIKENQIFWGRKTELICKIKEIKLQGEHNIENVLAAISAAKIFEISSEDIKKVLKKFEGVPFRQQFIKEVNGVKYFNDTTATMPEAVIKALKIFSKRFSNSNIILIAGGQNKGLDYKNLAKEINKKIKNLILLPGTATKEIKKSLTKNVSVLLANSMAKAVEMSSFLAKNGDIVLLSPGATSFNLFKNEFDRGEQFNKKVREFKNEK